MTQPAPQCPTPFCSACYPLHPCRPDCTLCHPPDDCHCGRPVHTYADGFTRDMCERCSALRCDVIPACPLPRPDCRP